MEITTFKAKLVAKEGDLMGYTNFVFEDLEYENTLDKYTMMVMFPNWDQRNIDIGDIGYVSYKFVEEGIDKWYDGNDFVRYKDTNYIFLKFIREKQEVKLGEIYV